MGQLRDIVNSVDNSANITNEGKEQLGFLMSLAEAKANVYEERIKGDLKDGTMGDSSLNVSIKKIIKSRTEYRAITKIGNTKIIDNVKKSIEQIFAGDLGIANGIARMATTALDAIMGAGEGQESEVKFYSVVTEYPSL